jgi:hypothetical protein
MFFWEYCEKRNKVLSIKIQSIPCRREGEGKVSKKTEACGDIALNGELETREKVEATLQRLHALKSMVSELRAQCENLQRLDIEDKSGAMLCDVCGRTIDTGQDVEAKNFGEKAHHYHKECFQKLWL